MGKGSCPEEFDSKLNERNNKEMLVLLPFSSTFLEISLELASAMLAFCDPGLQFFVFTLYDELSDKINVM